MSIVSPVSSRTDSPVRRRPARDEVRRALLDSAARVFARHGIDAASLDDVAADAGFTKGAVYSNFGSKQGLVDALVADRTTAYLRLGTGAADALERADGAGSLPDRARALGDELTAATHDQRDWHLLLFELWQRSVRTGDADDSLREQRRALLAGIEEAVAGHAQRAGARLPLPPRELAVVLVALVNGLAMERMLAPEDVPPELLGQALALLVGEG